MANTNSPFGFRPISRAGGAPFSVREYVKPSGDGQAIFLFDLLVRVTGASVAFPENASYNLSGVQSGYSATMSTAIWLGASLAYGAASTATFHPVTDEQDCIYIVQGKTGTTYSTASHAGKNADASITTAGSTTTKQSGMSLDGATLATTNTLGLRVLDIARIVPNLDGANNIFEIVINRHFFANQVAGV